MTQQAYIMNLLLEIGIPANLSGFTYAREMIPLFIDNKYLKIRIIEDVYKVLAEKYNNDWRNIERSLRHSIEYAFSYGNADLLEDIFKYSIKPTGTVSCKTFLITLAEYVKLNCSEKAVV